MFVDKGAAKEGKRRIPEKSLWLITIFGGSIGVFLGMKAPLFHKAAKPVFKIGVPVIMVIQVLMVLYGYFSTY